MFKTCIALTLSLLMAHPQFVVAQEQHAGPGEISTADRFHLEQQYSPKEIRKQHERHDRELAKLQQQFHSAKNQIDAGSKAYFLGKEYDDPAEMTVKPNFAEAIRWYEAGAEAGNNWCYLSIADMIAKGEWVLDPASVSKIIPLLQWAADP